ncbi:MAG: hypothetical protein PUF50_01285 [Erysipelotrichaceae bacterium]|nr:hypothetical protein [Erysipelotrichaceae bacterium]
MLKRSFNYLSMFAIGSFFIVLGCCFFLYTIQVWNWLYITLIVGISLTGILRIINVVWNYQTIQHRKKQVLDSALWAVLVVLSIFFPRTFAILLPRILGVWMLMHATVKLIVLYIKVKDHLPLDWMRGISLVFDCVVGCYLLIEPARHYLFLSRVIALYFMVYGLRELMDLVREILPSGSGTRLDQKIQLAIPPMMSALIPSQLMSVFLDRSQEDEVQRKFDAIKQDIIPDVEVLIHLAPSGPARFGHVDMIYQNTIFSYGCYDPHTRKLVGTMGDGVVIVSPVNTYLHNCLANENKVLVAFGISLNEQQKERLNQKILELSELWVEFLSDEQRLQQGLPCEGDAKDYISRVTRTSPQAKFYKFKEGRFKTFFVLSSNCVSFVAYLMKVIGLNLFDLSGIISPGAYYDFLNRQFMSHNGFIVSRKLYRKRDVKKFE